MAAPLTRGWFGSRIGGEAMLDVGGRVLGGETAGAGACAAVVAPRPARRGGTTCRRRGEALGSGRGGLRGLRDARGRTPPPRHRPARCGTRGRLTDNTAGARRGRWWGVMATGGVRRRRGPTDRGGDDAGGGRGEPGSGRGGYVSRGAPRGGGRLGGWRALGSGRGGGWGGGGGCLVAQGTGRWALGMGGAEGARWGGVCVRCGWAGGGGAAIC